MNAKNKKPIIVVLCSLLILIFIAGCLLESSTAPAPVKNKPPASPGSYYVAAFIGNFYGSNILAVSVGADPSESDINGTPYGHATVKINGMQMDWDSINQTYSFRDTGSISFAPGSAYALEVTNSGEIVATGSCVMPSVPQVTNIDFPYSHSLNTPLDVNWTPVSEASSIEVAVLRSIYDSNGIDIDSYSELLGGSTTKATIPDTLFSASGQYSLSLTAFNGFSSNIDVNELTSELIQENIEGAYGYFVAASTYPSSQQGLIINVGTGGPSYLPKNRTQGMLSALVTP